MRSGFSRQGRKRLLTVLLALNVLFIWGNSLLPPEASWAVSSAVKNVLLALLPGGDGAGGGTGWLGVLVRKLAHFTEFCVLGTLLRCRLGREPGSAARALLAGLLTAGIDETIQAFTGRTSSVFDVWIDFAGVTAGAALVYRLVSHIWKGRAQ